MIEIDKIYTGDCLELFQQVDDNSVDLVVTSPPYNLGIQYDVCQDKMTWPEYYQWMQLVLQEIFRVLKPGGRLCLNHYLSCGNAKTRASPLMDLNGISTLIGFKHHGIAIWDDRTLTKYQAWGSWLSARAPYVNSPFEGILILYKDHWLRDEKRESPIDKKEFMEACSGIWKLQPESRKHAKCPAPFPISLPGRCIRLLSFKEDLVLDPFAGSGTTCLAAKKEGRHYIGFELSPVYAEEARLRLTQSNMENWLCTT